MTKKRITVLIVGLFIIFFASILYRNIETYNSMKDNAGYTFGTIVKVWDDDGFPYTRYQYSVNGKTFIGRQGGWHDMHDTMLIVYDTLKPRFSMIATYPFPLKLDHNLKIIELNIGQVNYDWLDYLPGDEMHSFKDLWSLD